MVRAGRSAKRYLTTVLFTDIVGSTERATELGDRAWHELLEQHNALVRRQLRRFGGREVDTAGDGFFATFDAPAAAVACALTIVELVRQLGIEVRAGVHTGEVEASGPGLRGIAVHIGARIGASAGPGEVLVSATVHDLAAGSALAFQERGLRELKGVSGEWRLFAAQGGVRFDAEFGTAGPESGREVAAVRRSVEQRARRRRYAAVAAVLAAVALIGAGAFYFTRPPPSLPSVDANSAAVIDPASGRIVAQVALGARPEGIAAGEGAIWVANTVDGTIVRIDPDRRTVVETIQVGNAPRGVAVGGGSVWVTNSTDRTVSRINAGTNRIVQTIDVGSGAGAIAVGGNAVWVANEADGTLTRIGEASGAVTGTYTLSGAPGGLAADDAAVWVAISDTGTVAKLDPGTGQVVGSVAVGNGPRGLGIGGTAVWVANALDATVSRIDVASLRVTATVQVGEGATGLVVSPTAVWIACPLDGTLRRIDPDTTAVTTIQIGAAPEALAVSGDGLWLSAGASPASHRGGTLRILGSLGPDSIDPALSYGVEGWSILSMTNDGLVAFQRAGGIAGSRLVPDLAVAIPKPTDDGKTYTFQLRPGLTYSDGQPVKASDVRHGLERQYTAPAKSDAALPPFYSAIVGEEACQASTDRACDLAAGIETDDATGRITFYLTAADPDFLVKLALPLAFAVPSSVGNGDIGHTPIPATGAYMIVSSSDAEVRLARNPRFHEWSRLAKPDGFPDEIVFAIGPAPDEQLDMLVAGTADGSIGGPNNRPGLDHVEAFRVQHPELLHTWTAGVIALFMNTGLPPFDSLDVRRAVNLAIDRRKAVDAIGGPLAAQLTCQAIPPDLQGYRPYCPYTVDPDAAGTWTGPDVAAAQALIAKSGAAGAKVTLMALGPFDDLETYLSGVLSSLGFKVEVAEPPQDAPPDLDVINGVITGWFADYPAASGAIVPLFGCGEPTNFSHFCDDTVSAAIAKANDLQQTDFGAAAAAWAEVDRAVVDLGPLAPLANRRGVDLVGSRVGNYQHHPVWLVLFDQLWVQ